MKIDALSVNDLLEKRLLSVNPHHNCQKFTDKSLENAGLSVKCGLLTDKQAKNAALSVKLRKILAKIGQAALH